MKQQQIDPQWKVRLSPALQSKVSEFHLHGYDRATTDEVWNCVLTRRKKKKDVKLHDLFNDILVLSPSHYMTWLTTQSYSSNDWMSSFKDMDLD
jgi:hypothetical protein